MPPATPNVPAVPRPAAARAIHDLFAAIRTRTGALHVAAVCAVAVAFWTLAGPFLHAGLPAGHDVRAHVTYTYLFDRAADAGQFPVRWTQGVRAGDGQPLFSFYQPGFYYAVRLVHVFGPPLALSIKVAMLLLWIGGAAFMYWWWRHLGRLPAALGALIFAGSPYLLLDVNVRASYPEFAAIVCAVGTLWALARLIEQPSARRAGLVAVLLAGALVCHLPATLIFTPVFLLRAVASCVTSPARRRALLWCAGSALLAGGLASFYVLPALGERHLIQMGALTRDYFDYRQHFVAPAQWIRFTWGSGASVPGDGDGMSFQVGLVQWMVIGVAAAVCIGRAVTRRTTRRDVEPFFWLAVVAFALFMTSQASAGVWAAVPELAYLQFPWRFLMLVAVACGCLAAHLLARVPRPQAQALVVLAAAIVLIVASRDQRRPEHYVPRSAMEIDRREWAQTPEARAAAFVEPGYFPAGAGSRPAPGPTPESRPRWSTSAPGSSVTARGAADHQLELEVSSAQGTDVVLAFRMFPGWTFRLDEREIASGRDPRSGFVRLHVPAGSHTLKADFRDTPTRRAANGVSAASATSIVLAFAAWVGSVARRRGGAFQSDAA